MNSLKSLLCHAKPVYTSTKFVSDAVHQAPICQLMGTSDVDKFTSKYLKCKYQKLNKAPLTKYQYHKIVFYSS